MSSGFFKQFDWEKLINAHSLESSEPTDWLNYGVALLQTLEPGGNAGNQQQQAAIAFVQALKEGATSQQVSKSLKRSALECIRCALQSTDINSKITGIQSP